MKEILRALREKNIEYAVLSNKLCTQKLIQDLDGYNVSSYIDTRSAAYAAIGISVEKNVPVLLIAENDNDSRNCYSALTEAYYKKLPIIFLSLKTGEQLNYEIELSDCVIGSAFINKNSVFDLTLVERCLNKSQPIHLICNTESPVNLPQKNIDKIIDILNPNDNYIYISNTFLCGKSNCYITSVAGGSDGVVSNVLGASLSGKYKKYIGVAPDLDIIHDINTFGNRHMNNYVSFVISSTEHEKVISDYAKNFGFKIYYGLDSLKNINKVEKSIFFLNGDQL